MLHEEQVVLQALLRWRRTLKATDLCALMDATDAWIETKKKQEDPKVLLPFHILCNSRHRPGECATAKEMVNRWPGPSGKR